MEILSLQLLLLWLGVLWLGGWLILPLSRRVFSALPDGGLAAGRLLILVLVCVVVFWGASLRLFSAGLGPWILGLLSSGIVVVGWPRLWRREEERQWLRAHRRGLLASDLIFLSAFLFFAWLRLCQPEINQFEKPMDSAIIGVLSRSDYLPAENPWFAGQEFTNYYYFGHFMASQLKRAFGTSLPYAYNLIQPAFCAFFLSTLWSLCAALCGSLKRGAGAMVFIGLLGHLEPLRQWFSDAEGPSFPGADWWNTSRVIPHTINEYPAFTLMLGDVHAHFFALSLASLLFCLCYELTNAAASARRSFSLAQLCGVVLGAIVMTNTWDAPLYGLMVWMALWLGRRNWKSFLAVPAVAFLVPLIFLARYQSQVGGIVGEWWVPEPLSFLLLWGLFLAAWAAILLRITIKSPRLPQRLLGAGTVALAVIFIVASLRVLILLPMGIFLLLLVSLQLFIGEMEKAVVSNRFEMVLASGGMLALLLPMIFYLNGYFGGDLRHQDTVFKFGLQAWLMLGTAASCGLWRWVGMVKPAAVKVWPGLDVKKAFMVYGLLLAWCVPLLCSYSVYRARADKPGNLVDNNDNMAVMKEGRQITFFQYYWGYPDRTFLTLNGACFLQMRDRHALQWMERHAAPNAYVVELVGKDEQGNWIQAYGEYGLISALSGVPAYIGWAQHARFWGANPQEVDKRLKASWELFDTGPQFDREGRFFYPRCHGKVPILSSNRSGLIFWSATMPLPVDSLTKQLKPVFEEDGTVIFESGK